MRELLENRPQIAVEGRKKNLRYCNMTKTAKTAEIVYI